MNKAVLDTDTLSAMIRQDVLALSSLQVATIPASDHNQQTG